jgi:hypothetical protein
VIPYWYVLVGGAFWAVGTFLLAWNERRWGYRRGFNAGTAKGAEVFQDIMNEKVVPYMLRRGFSPMEIAKAIGASCGRPGCTSCAKFAPPVN